MNVLYDTDEDKLYYGVPSDDAEVVSIFKKRYGKIGQDLREISNAILRREYPHFVNESPYTHIIPKEDVIEHTMNSGSVECPCQPVIDTTQRIVRHHAMDARPAYDGPDVDETQWEVIS